MWFCSALMFDKLIELPESTVLNGAFCCLWDKTGMLLFYRIVIASPTIAVYNKNGESCRMPVDMLVFVFFGHLYDILHICIYK